MNPTASLALPLLRQVFAEGMAYTAQGERIPLHSSVSPEEADGLYQLVRALKPEFSLEIGFAQGISTLAILQALSDNERGHHHVIDPYQHNFQDVGLAMVARAGLSQRMTFHHDFPEQAVPLLPRLQFVFIDSSHLFDLTLLDFVLADKRLEIGGRVAFHDLWMPSLQKLIRFILANRAYRLCPEERAAGRSVSLPTNRPTDREVLECASPLALSLGPPRVRERQRTGALQDAVAPSMARLGSWPQCASNLWRWNWFRGSMREIFRRILSRRLKAGLGKALAKVPGSAKMFSEECLRPWCSFSSSNLVVLEKTAEDQRDWRFHRSF